MIGIVAVLAGIVPYTKKVIEFNKRAQNSGPENYSFTKPEDFLIALAFMMFFLVTHLIWLKIVPPLMEPICKEQKDLKDRKRRSKKMALMLYGFILYTCTSIWGFQILKETEFFPKALGGKGDPWKLFDQFPFQKEIPGMKMYYMCVLGWHLEGFLKMLILDGIRPDVIEMSLHHFVTAYLVAGSYLINLVNLGACIEFIHDFTDIFIAAARGSSESKYRTFSYVSMAFNLSFWCYARLIVFTHLIYVTHSSNVMSDNSGDGYII